MLNDKFSKYDEILNINRFTDGIFIYSFYYLQASQKVIEYSFIKKKLCFSNTSDTIKFIEVCGFTNMGDKGFSIKERKPYTDYIESYKKWKQRDSLKILDDKKEKRFRCDLMELGIEMDEITKFKEKYEK